MMLVPHRIPSFLPHLFPSSLIWRFSDAQPELYLTFDDGPVPGPTDFVMETLRKFNCEATFFCIGDNIRKNPNVFGKLKEGGFATGNHTFNHLNGWKTDNAQYFDNISKCDQYLGSSNKIFRPPYGRIKWSQIRGLPERKIIMWDVLSLDYEKSLSPEDCLRNSIRATRNGSIIVFHDSFKAEKNMMYALPRFIEHFLSKGFVFRMIRA